MGVTPSSEYLAFLFTEQRKNSSDCRGLSSRADSVGGKLMKVFDRAVCFAQQIASHKQVIDRIPEESKSKGTV